MSPSSSFLAFLFLLGSCSVFAQEPSGFPLSLSPILFDSCPFEERLDAFAPNGSLFVMSRWSRDLNAPMIQSSLLQWRPATIQPRAGFLTQITSNDAFFQTSAPAADFTLNAWSPPTILKPSTLPNSSLVSQFARRDFATATLSFSEWTFASGRGVLSPLNIFGGSNNFTDPLPYEPMISSQTFQPLPQPRWTPSSADLVDFAPVADIVVSNGAFTHLLVQSGDSLKLLSYDASWTLLRKSIVIPALGTKRGPVERVQVLTNYRVSVAADDTTGGVWVVISMESPQFMSAIVSLLNVTISPSSKPTVLFWVPPPSAASTPSNSTVDMRLVTAVTVPGCQALWSTVFANSGRVALTGTCTINSSSSSQHLWVADVQLSPLGVPTVSTVVNRQINWDHRSRTGLSSVNDLAFVESGSKLLVAGAVGFDVSSSGATSRPGDAFVSLFDLSLNEEIVQARWGTSRNNEAARLVFLARNSSVTDSPHTAPLSASFPFRVLVPATINGPTEADSSLSRFSVGAVYELLFEACSAVSSSQCIGSGKSVVGTPTDQSCVAASDAKGIPVGVIVGGVIGGFVALVFLVYIAYRLNHVFGHKWAQKRVRQIKKKKRMHLVSVASEDPEVTTPVLSGSPELAGMHVYLSGSPTSALSDSPISLKELPAPIITTPSPELSRSPGADVQYRELV